MTIGLRALYWTGVVTVSLVIAVAVRAVLDRPTSRWPRPLAVAATPVVFAAIFAPALYGTNRALAGDADWTDIGLAGHVVVVQIVALSIALLTELLRPKPAAETAGLCRLAERLGLGAGVQIWHLTVDNHHVEVRTATGARHRVLMRLSDAVAEVGGIPGRMVHRSHWVADAAITCLARAGGRDVLLMRDGSAVPVSRTYRAGLERWRAAPPQPEAAAPEAAAVRSEGPAPRR